VNKIENPADGGASVGEIVETLGQGRTRRVGAAPRSRDAVFLQRCRQRLGCSGNKVSAVSWTKERTARLRELHARGLSSREIAHKLDVSRDSVIGKLSRLKLGRQHPCGERITSQNHGNRFGPVDDVLPVLPTMPHGADVPVGQAPYAAATRPGHLQMAVRRTAVVRFLFLRWGRRGWQNRIVNTTAASPISPGDSQPLAVLLFRAFGYGTSKCGAVRMSNVFGGGLDTQSGTPSLQRRQQRYAARVHQRARRPCRNRKIARFVIRPAHC